MSPAVGHCAITKLPSNMFWSQPHPGLCQNAKIVSGQCPKLLDVLDGIVWVYPSACNSRWWWLIKALFKNSDNCLLTVAGSRTHPRHSFIAVLPICVVFPQFHSNMYIVTEFIQPLPNQRAMGRQPAPCLHPKGTTNLSDGRPASWGWESITQRKKYIYLARIRPAQK